MSANTQSIRILHVDDDPAFAEMAATFLEREDDRFDVETVTSGRAGLERLGDGAIDCVVSDYDMPGLNGIEFLEAVRSEHPDVPFVLFTGKGSEAVASDAISAGVTDYLQKGHGSGQYELLANRIQNAVEQYRSRQRAAELDRIRTLASDVNQALVHAETRRELEADVCEIISDSEPYRFAWIGELDPETDRIVPRRSAGVEGDYLDAITVTADDAPTGRGPGGTAVRERRISVSQNVAEDPEFEPWRDEALERGFRAVAAVPLEHGTTLYGELVVYAGRPDAFDAEERDLLVELADDVAHALHSFAVRDSLREARNRRRALFENAPGPVIAGEIRDGDHRIVDVNDAFEDVFGYDGADVVGRDVADVVVPETGKDTHEAVRERAAAGETTVTEVERRTSDGLRPFLLTVIPYGGDEGRATGWYAWYTDISERRAYERAIEELHEKSDELMAATTAEAVAERTSEAVRDIIGLPANGVHLYDEAVDGLVPVAWTAETESRGGGPPPNAPGEGLAGTAYETGETQVYDDISTVPDRLNPGTAVRSQIVLPLGDHGVLLVGSPEADDFDDVDVSIAETLVGHATAALDRVEREETLGRRQSLFEAILETSIDGILVVDENREYVTWNQQFVDMWGMPEELLGDRPERAGLEYILEELENPQAFIDTVEHLYEHPHEESRDMIHLADGRVFDRYSAPVEAADGTYFGRVWFFRDVTDRRDRERELERQNERLEKFASIVSHDLRNPLNVAAGRLALAREGRDGDHLDSAARAVDRSLKLVDDLLTLAREGQHVSSLEAVDLAATCAGCWETVETSDATLAVETERTVRADPGQLKQLLENLMRNAVEHGSASPPSGHADAEEHGGAGVTVTVGEVEGGFYVADDGPGIPEDDREAVFEAGYSTTEDGTGFGLNIVAEIVAAHGWEIAAVASESGGARFELTDVEFADG